MHPIADVLSRHASKVQVVTYGMTEVPGGLHVIMMSMTHSPDYFECRLTGANNRVTISPEGGTEAISILGDSDAETAPHVYGLGHCLCCTGERWPLTISIVPLQDWPSGVPHVSTYLGGLLGVDMMARPEKYCLRDQQSLMVRRRSSN